jgi:hypothetical protein
MHGKYGKHEDKKSCKEVYLLDEKSQESNAL